MSRAALRDPIAAVWLVLVAATVVSWWLGTEHIGDASLSTTLVLAVAFVKARLVGTHFIGLREAPRHLRVAFDVYLAATFAALVAMYLAQ
jgi:caa(3)-type oxidase subunit IV